MKLIREPTSTIESIQLTQPAKYGVLGRIKQFLGYQVEPIEPAFTYNVPLRRLFDEVVIDFGVNMPFDICGLKIQQLDIGRYTLHGVIPLALNEDRTYRCCIDYFEINGCRNE